MYNNNDNNNNNNNSNILYEEEEANKGLKMSADPKGQGATTTTNETNNINNNRHIDNKAYRQKHKRCCKQANIKSKQSNSSSDTENTERRC